jgi:RNA polymerase sigma factor (sigma-70 family)
MNGTAIEELVRELAPQVLAALGGPDDPKAWLITVASRRRIELWRSDSARRRREETVVALAHAQPVPEPPSAADDTLTLFLLCCHPSLTPVSQVALTLRAVGGLTTAEIARALLVPESTMAQRISRAKARIKADGAEFRMLPPAERPARLAAVCTCSI